MDQSADVASSHTASVRKFLHGPSVLLENPRQIVAEGRHGEGF